MIPVVVGSQKKSITPVPRFKKKSNWISKHFFSVDPISFTHFTDALSCVNVIECVISVLFVSKMDVATSVH